MTSSTVFPLRGWRAATLGLAALALAGCATGGRGVVVSWPGLSAGEDRLFVADGPAVFAVDLNGAPLWRYPQQAVRDLTFFAPPAVSDDGVVYAGAYTGQVFALPADGGDPIWQFPAADGSDGAPDGRVIGSPTIAGDILLVPTDGGTLFFLDRLTGKTLRTFDAVGQLWSAPHVEGNTVYLTSLAHTVYAIDLTSAEELWHRDLGHAIADSPTLDGGTLLAGILGESLVALNVQDGEPDWRSPTVGWLWGNPAVADGTAYFGDAVPATLSTPRSGNLYALDLATQRVVWQKATAAISSSPVIVGDQVIVAFEDGHLIAFDRVNGGTLWDRTVDAPIYTDPVVAGDLVAVAMTSKTALLQAFDAATGAPAWTYLPAESQ